MFSASQKKARRWLLIGALCMLLAAFSLAPQKAYACACAAPNTPQNELENSNVVFTGTVTDFKDVGGGVLFEISSAFKGISHGQKTVTVGTGSAAGGDCPIEFVKGDSYLVYARVLGGSLYTDDCSRTMLLEKAADDLAALAPLRSASGVTIAVAVIVAGLIIVMLGPILSFFVRKKKQHT